MFLKEQQTIIIIIIIIEQSTSEVHLNMAFQKPAVFPFSDKEAPNLVYP
jgi:hypothetical protein